MPENFIYRLIDALEGSRSKSVYATDAKFLPNSRINHLRTPITDDFLEVSDKAAIQCLCNGHLIAGKFVSDSPALENSTSSVGQIFDFQALLLWGHLILLLASV